MPEPMNRFLTYMETHRTGTGDNIDARLVTVCKACGLNYIYSDVDLLIKAQSVHICAPHTHIYFIGEPQNADE